MDIATIQLIVYIAIVIGAFLKYVLKTIETMDGITTENVSAFIAALIASVLIANQVITGITIPNTENIATIISLVITAFTLGYGAVEAAGRPVNIVKTKVLRLED